MTLTCHLLLPLNNNTDYNSCKTFSFLIYHKQNFIVIFCLKEVCTLIYNGRNQLASITTRLRCIKQIYCIFVQFWYKKHLLNPLNSRFYCLLMKGHTVPNLQHFVKNNLSTICLLRNCPGANDALVMSTPGVNIGCQSNTHHL